MYKKSYNAYGKYIRSCREVYHDSNLLCSFGSSDDGFRLVSECNINTESSSDLGCDEEYELPQGIKIGTTEARSYLTG